MIEAIVAIGDNGEVGFKGWLPWPKNPKDLEWFRALTMGKTCVVGHRTAEKLPALAGRKVLVMSRDETPQDLIEVYKDLIIIGGPAMYKLWLPFIDRFHIARIRGLYEADTYLKEWALWTQE